MMPGVPIQPKLTKIVPEHVAQASPAALPQASSSARFAN
jgi:hypothetical protein